MAAKFHVKKGDEVVVIAGNHKGARGKVLQVIPKKEQVIVEHVRMIKKHVRRSQEHPQGAIVEKEGPIHISNVMRADVYDQSKRRSAA
jgi:large subunit ribosomal protein L24